MRYERFVSGHKCPVSEYEYFVSGNECFISDESVDYKKLFLNSS